MPEYMFEKFNEYKIVLLVEELDAVAENIEQRLRRTKLYTKMQISTKTVHSLKFSKHKSYNALL